MSKIVSVSQLKVGDKFVFVNGQSGGAPSPLNQESKTAFMVTRPPSVNLAANTCYFRYQSAAMSEDEAAHRESNQSFNGAPDMQVRLPDAEPAGAESASAVPASAAVKSPPIAPEEKSDFAWPAKPAQKRAVSAEPKSESSPRAKSKPAKAAAAKPDAPKLPPAPDAQAAKRPVTPAAPKSAPEPPMSKLPTLKKVVFEKATAGKKRAPKKAAPPKGAAKKPAKRKSAPKK